MDKYIGARYMPKFEGLYDASTAYEALSIVDNGMGTSYVANRPVPAGTPLTDSDYWSIYGSSSGAIIHLQDQINDINDELAVMNANKILFIGDSYNNLYPNEGWDVVMINELGLSVDDYFQINISGMGFCTTPSWIDALTNRLSSITNKESYKAIIIGSGGNDKAYPLADIITAMSTFKTLANTNFPNAEIYVGFLGWSGFASDHPAFRDGLLKYIEACDAVGFKYLHNVEFVLHWHPYLRDNTAIIPTDYIHPTSAGLVALGQKMSQAYLTGECHVKYSAIMTLTADGVNCSNIAGASISVTLDNDVVNIIMSPQTLSLLTAIAVRSGKIIGSFSCDCFNPASIITQATASDLTNDKAIMLALGFQNGSLSIAPIVAMDAHNTQIQQNSYMFLSTSC